MPPPPFTRPHVAPDAQRIPRQGFAPSRRPHFPHPEVLYGVIKVIADRGPIRILVSDRCFSAKFTADAPKTIDVIERRVDGWPILSRMGARIPHG
jgi:hypothetical protein